jgi:hypothetical protein
MQAHSQTVRITNTTKASVEGDVKASSSDRYTINPSSFRLKPGEAAELSISLRLEPKFAQRRKAIDSGQRDAIFIKVCAGGPLVLKVQTHAQLLCFCMVCWPRALGEVMLGGPCCPDQC